MNWLMDHTYLSGWLSLVLAVLALLTKLRNNSPKCVTLSGMSIDSLISQIDSEISRLERARKLLASFDGIVSPKPKRKMSAAARKKIAAAQRKRWAKVRKAAKKIA